MVRILVGSPSILKVEAAQAAVDKIGLEAEVIGLACRSGVPSQPYGMEETLAGAWNRARAAHQVDPLAYAIGIENGLMKSGSSFHDVAYAIVITPEGREFERRSEPVPVPEGLARRALDSDRTKTIGEFEAERSGCDPADPHAVWTEGRTNRKDILVALLYPLLIEATDTALVTEKGETP